MSADTVIYHPPVQQVMPSGGSGYVKRTTALLPPTIVVQTETGSYARNYHEINKGAVVDEDLELVVPPWAERRQTPDEIAVERKFWAMEEHWESQYWAAVERKQLEMARQLRRLETSGRRPAPTTVVPRQPPAHSSSVAQRADSCRRPLKKESSARSTTSSKMRDNASLASSECNSVRPAAGGRRPSLTNGGLRSAGGRGVSAARAIRPEDTQSIHSLRYRVDRTETESVYTASSAWSEDDGKGGRGAGQVPTRSHKLSPRQQLLQQQQQTAPHRSRPVVTTPEVAHQFPAPINVHSTATNATSTLTTPFGSKCFTVPEGTDPFKWGPAKGRISAWLAQQVFPTTGPSPPVAPTSPQPGPSSAHTDIQEEPRTQPIHSRSSTPSAEECPASSVPATTPKRVSLDTTNKNTAHPPPVADAKPRATIPNKESGGCCTIM